MAAPPILLVADDLSVIASVKRVLAREGYECVLATSAADAVIAFGHLLPGLVILQPSVESERGGVLLEELQGHPDARLLRVLLLGETIPGFAWPVVPLPLDPEYFATSLDENIRTTDEAGSWSVLETAAPPEPTPVPEDSPREQDDWRATSPQDVDREAPASTDEMPEPQAIVADATPPDATQRQELAPAPTPPEPNMPDALEEKLFGDLAADVEASAMQSVESSLPRAVEEDDEELTRLEDEVRAEAQRRRLSREARAVTVKPAPELPPPVSLPGAQPEGEESFEDMSETPAPPPSRAVEVLSRAEQMVLDSRAQSEAQQRAEEADLRALREEAATATRRAEVAEEALRAEREARGGSEDELARLTAEFANERELFRVRHENELETLKADLDAAREANEGRLESETRKRADAERALDEEKERSAALQLELEESSAQVATARSEAGKRNALEQKLEQATEQVSALQTQLAELQATAGEATEEKLRLEHANATALEAQLAELQEAVAAAAEQKEAQLAAQQALNAQLAERDLQLEELSRALDLARPLAEDAGMSRMKLEEVTAQLTLTEQHLAEARKARDDAQTEMLSIEEARDALQAQLTEVEGRLQAAEADVTSASELLEDTAKERDTLRARIATLEPFHPLAEKLGVELEAETRRRTGLEAELEDATRSLDSTRTHAESLEATAVMASEKVKVLEAREVMSLALPGKRTVGVARHGSVELEGLARVVSQLVIGNAEVRLELGTQGGTRNLWFKRGQIIASESSLEHESLIARARRDGLIDARQEAELRMLKGATPREQLEALKSRGFIRDIESVPLVQRYTEQVALDAFTEEKTLYRVVEETPRPEVLLATVPRPTLPMLAESLRRAVAPDVMLERLGGGEAVPMATDSELDLRALGFSERERKMLTWVDGEATIEDLSLASGLKPDLAFRALLVAQLLGIVEVRPGTKKTEASSGQLDLQRLEAKFDEVQDADYFTILGLSRAAGTEDVRRAFQRLTQEFDPLRFSGHPDPSIQQRAQVVANLLEEAARALEDDRRRVEYARHLLD